MTPKEVNLIQQFIEYFNQYRNAKIASIGTVGGFGPYVRYEDDREVKIRVKTFTELFDKLAEMHPRYPDTTTATKRATRGSQAQEEASQ